MYRENINKKLLDDINVNRQNIDYLLDTIDDLKLPKIYGILTPASSMGTTLIDRLQNSGMIFSIISDF